MINSKINLNLAFPTKTRTTLITFSSNQIKSTPVKKTLIEASAAATVEEATRKPNQQKILKIKLISIFIKIINVSSPSIESKST